MRSCLIQFVIMIAVIFALLWFGLPFGASWLATNVLNAAGFSGTNTKVTVSADLPPRILLGHADRVRITSSQVTVGDLKADAIDVTLGDVDLLKRTIGSARGTLTGVHMVTANGDPVTFDTVTINGVGTGATATLTMPSADLGDMVLAQLKAQKLKATSVTFAAPNVVTVTVGKQSKKGQVLVKNGALQVTVACFSPSTITVMDAGTGNPFHFTSVSVAGGTVTLVGTIDLESLLGL
jgi:hypothetical protein